MFINMSRTVCISAISDDPISSILQLPLRHLRCPQSFPPTYQRRHQRNRPLTCHLLRYQEEHRRAGLLRPFSTLLHLLPKLHFSSCSFRQVLWDLWAEAIASYSCSRRARPRRFFPVRTLSALVGPPPISSVPHFFHCLSSVTLPMLCPLFPHCFTAFQQPGILFFFLQDPCSSSPCCGLRDLMQEPSTVFRTLDHLILPSLMQFFHLSLLTLLFHFFQQNTICAWFLPLLDGATLSRSLPPATQQPTICCQRPALQKLVSTTTIRKGCVGPWRSITAQRSSQVEKKKRMRRSLAHLHEKINGAPPSHQVRTRCTWEQQSVLFAI